MLIKPSIINLGLIKKVMFCDVIPQSAKLNNLNFHPLEVVSGYRGPQLQVGEHCSHLFNLRPNICKS